MPAFEITRPKDVIRIDGDGHGAAVFVVTSRVPDPIRARLDVIPGNPADQAMFNVEDGPDRNMRLNDTQNVRVILKVPLTAASGPHMFRLRVVDADAPNERYEESQPVEFAVPEHEGPKPVAKGRWWIIPLAAILLLVAGITGWYLYAYPKLGDYRQQSVDTAKLDLTSKGMTVTVLTDNIVLDQKQDAMVVDLLAGGKPATAGMRVKRGTAITIEASGSMPELVGGKKDAALSTLSRLQLPQPSVIHNVATTSLDPAAWDMVQFQSPDAVKRPGQPAPSGGGIELWVSVKPDLVPTPPVIGKAYCDAASAVSQLGLTPVQIANPIVFFQTSAVMTQSPAPGTPILKGQPVTLMHFGVPITCGIASLKLFNTFSDLKRNMNVVK